MTGVVGTMALLPEPFPQCVLRLFGFVRSEGRAIRRDEDNEISSSSLAALRRRYNQQSERELCWLHATRVYLKVDPLIIHRREGEPFKIRGRDWVEFSSKTIITLNGATEWG